MRRTLWMLLAGLAMTALGCRTWERQPAPRTTPPPAPMAPFGQPQPLPPGSIPSGAPPSNPNTANPFPIVPPPGPTPNMPSGALPPEPEAKVDSKWSAAEGRVESAPPDPLAGQDKVKLYPPEVGESTTKEPPLLKNKQATALPVGIPQFTAALENVAGGLRPALDDGLDWLQSKGYRTVLHIHLPGETDSADRKQVEKRNMKYLSLEVSPQALTGETVEEFNRLVRDLGKQPLFVYDRDGSLAGGLWYLYFRQIEQHSDEVARLRAGALGLRPDRDGPHRDMWQAVQKMVGDGGR
jgi:protein tyrosine phosphatase (PTP) superfamily phosphohydrolase (DUF442 family)